jgi:biotin carboxyl carrier protein
VSAKSGKLELALDQVRELVALMRECGVSELTVELADLRVTIKRPLGEQAAGAAGASQQAPTLATPGQPELAELVAVSAPQVGIFTLGSGEPRVMASPGDWIVAGQVLGGVEAMNITNEVRAPVSGRVAEILVADGAAVEYGQTLFLIESGGGAGNEQMAS